MLLSRDYGSARRAVRQYRPIKAWHNLLLGNAQSVAGGD
ncbi:hypothetical protein RIEGSTA812A_PEG_1003 [invertebrate metagenome]|uniref:Uncharacterized protein n=1 Tax=invertebrate metagenome TaxID=1711999 RepID=A0A484H7G1_9ZZZZ